MGRRKGGGEVRERKGGRDGGEKDGGGEGRERRKEDRGRGEGDRQRLCNLLRYTDWRWC